jgi:ankyrin repeat protein
MSSSGPGTPPPPRGDGDEIGAEPDAKRPAVAAAVPAHVDVLQEVFSLTAFTGYGDSISRTRWLDRSMWTDDQLSEGLATLAFGPHRRTLLMLAARNGDISRMAKLLRLDHVPIDAKDARGRTALYYAAKAGSLEATMFLLDHGAQLRQCNCVLHAALEGGHEAVAFAVLAAGALSNVPIDAKDNEGRTALYYAAKAGLLEAVTILLQHGADVRQNVSILHAALEGGHEAVALDLLAAGAIPDEQVEPRHMEAAIRGGCSQVVFRALREIGTGLRELYFHKTLRDAALAGRLDVLECLVLDLGVNPDARGPESEGLKTAMCYAISAGKAEAISWLMEHGADVGLGWNEYGPAICEFSDDGFVEAKDVRPVEWKERSIATPVLAAARDNRIDFLRTIVAHVVDVNVAGFRGMTPLMYAAGHGNMEMVQLLVLENADPLALDHGGRDAAARARLRGHDDVANYLRNLPVYAGAVNSWVGAPSLLVAVAHCGDLETVQRLLDAGVDPNETYGVETALTAACAQSNAGTMIELLLAQGADPRLGNAAALRTAVRYGRIEALSALLAHTPTLATTPPAEFSALNLALRANSPSLDVIEMLLKAGAPADVRGTRETRSNLVLAARHKDAEVSRGAVRLLLDHGADVHQTVGPSSSADALRRALEAGNEDTALLLLERGANPCPVRAPEAGPHVMVAVEHVFPRAVAALLAGGAHANLPAPPSLAGRNANGGNAPSIHKLLRVLESREVDDEYKGLTTVVKETGETIEALLVRKYGKRDLEELRRDAKKAETEKTEKARRSWR